MFFTLYLVKDIALAANWLLLARYFLDANVRVRKILSAVVTVAAVANAAVASYFYSTASDFTNADIVSDIVSFILYIVLLISVFVIKNKLSVFMFLFCYNCVTEMIYSIAAPYLPSGIITRLVFYCILYTLIAVIIFICTKVLPTDSFPNMISTTPKWIFVATILFCLACYYRQFGIAASWYEVIYSTSAVMMIICIIFFVGNTVINTSRMNSLYKQMNELSDYCDSLAKSDEELRAFRHDYKNHMQVMSLLLKNGKISDAEKYIGNLSGSTLSFIKKYSSGNIILDSILSSKASIASKSNTLIKFSGYFPPDGIDVSDVCTVTSNLLDNAVEACEKIEGEKVITVDSQITNSKLILTVSNPCVKIYKNTNGEIVTSKGDKKNHGYGIKNIKKIAEKYSGFAEIENSDDVFSVSVVMQVSTISETETI